MRIGLFGGSFDPVHSEHTALARAAIDSLSLDKLFVLPAHTPPHKRGKTLSEGRRRLEMCRLAFADLPQAEVSDYEIKRGGTSYTYLTCRHFKELYPTAELYFLVGTDMLRDFPTWKNPEMILSTATLAVCARAEKADWLERERAAFANRFHTDFAVIGYHGAPVSSTEIRVLAGAGMRLTPYVSEAVERYIYERKLYDAAFAKEALALEKPTRAAHSVRVAVAAAKRGAQLPVSERKVIRAALLHDCAKNLSADSPLLRGFALRKEWGEVPEQVLHQFTGAYVAENAFGVRDREVLNAIRFHTSGRARISTLGALIFLADMIEEERAYEGVEILRELYWQEVPKREAQTALFTCLEEALRQTIAYLEEKGKRVYPLTRRAYTYYKNRTNDKKRIEKREVVNEMENTGVTSKDLALAVCKALADKRGKDIVRLYVREKTDLCDYFVVASGSNAPQIRAMGERVEELVEKELGVVPTRTEGVRDGRWAVVDYGDVIVHIFNDETRLFYHLERLWTDGGNIEKFNDKTNEFEGLAPNEGK